MSRPWDTSSLLVALLDAMEADLLDTSVDEVQAALRETGQAREGAIQELRSLLRDVQADGHDRCLPATLADEHGEMETRRH